MREADRRHREGLAGRAAKLAARFGFEHAGLIRVEVVVAVGNEKSMRVAEKIGAHYEGILLNRVVVGKSIYDARMYSLIAQDFGLMARLYTNCITVWGVRYFGGSCEIIPKIVIFIEMSIMQFTQLN